MQTIGHHTCKKDGGKDFVEKNAPFPSQYDTVEKNYPFLGTGFYYWDNNFDFAKWWGESQEKRYHKHFFIVQSDLNLPSDTNLFLDLVGNRTQMIMLKALMNRHKQKGYENQKWILGAFIEYLKRISQYNSEVFPWKVIRAIDDNALPQNKDIVGTLTPPPNEPDTYLFVKKKENYINLNPRLVICLLDKDSLILQSVKVIYES